MRAKINPGRNYSWAKKKDAEIAEAYGLTLSEFRGHSMQFLQCEGYDDDGSESETLHEWLTRETKTYRDNTPWQKGDDLDN